MTKSAPGKHYRDGLTMAQAVRLFSDEAKIERMFIEVRWPNGLACPFCGSAGRRPDRPTKPDILPVPRLQEQLLNQDWHRHAKFEAPAHHVGAGLLPVLHEPQGRIQHEASP